ncbi:hypothetical protein [Aliidiomarina indica]|uniref:hypothetical protein n=1 Tax=Aliidiomarina indica TaxID=2749147 RepID=UPI00188EB8DD|nr:hypothetical protein [Aliidiomarina indica]
MSNSTVKAFLRRLHSGSVHCDTKPAKSTLDALMRAQQTFYCHSNSGNAKAAHEAWQNVEMLAHEVEQLVLGGVIELYEGDL